MNPFWVGVLCGLTLGPFLMVVLIGIGVWCWKQ